MEQAAKARGQSWRQRTMVGTRLSVKFAFWKRSDRKGRSLHRQWDLQLESPVRGLGAYTYVVLPSSRHRSGRKDAWKVIQMVQSSRLPSKTSKCKPGKAAVLKAQWQWRHLYLPAVRTDRTEGWVPAQCLFALSHPCPQSEPQMPQKESKTGVETKLRW